jgi:hypothetical protein
LTADLTADERGHLDQVVGVLGSLAKLDGFQFGEVVLAAGIPEGWSKRAWGQLVRDAAGLPFKDGSVSSYMNPNRRTITDRVNASRYATETGRDKARQASRTVKARRIATGEVAEYERERYASHPQHQLAHKVRSRFAHALRRYGEGGTKPAKTFDLIGCTIPELLAHLERQFEPGMTLNNVHIDHKRPLASFDLADPDQVREAMFWTNLQPLWPSDNLSKGSSWESKRHRLR